MKEFKMNMLSLQNPSFTKFLESIVAALFATFLSYFVAFQFQWISSVDPLELFAVFTSYSCTYMCVRETRWNYPMGVITTLAYSILFYKWELYALAAFNLYLVFSLAYGYFRWRNDTDTRPVSTIKPNLWALGYVALGAGVWGLLTAANHIFNGSMSEVEIWITVLSGVAQFMLDNKKLENWIVWAVVNVVSIRFYFSNGMPIVGFQYIFFLANTIFGLTMWYRSMKTGEKLVTPNENTLA